VLAGDGATVRHYREIYYHGTLPSFHGFITYWTPFDGPSDSSVLVATQEGNIVKSYKLLEICLVSHLCQVQLVSQILAQKVKKLRHTVVCKSRKKSLNSAIIMFHVARVRGDAMFRSKSHDRGLEHISRKQNAPNWRGDAEL